MRRRSTDEAKEVLVPRVVVLDVCACVVVSGVCVHVRACVHVWMCV